MEHRLILGGEQYLPFARSCVVKLKKLGLPYANQSFEVDGVSIKVRIEPGHEYIRIEGGSELMQMDSGVVDLGYVYATPYANCKLHEVAANASYNTGFTTTLTTWNKVLKTDEVWKTNPSKLSAGQLSGDVYKEKSFKGRVPPDDRDARSFSARMDPVVADPPISPPDRQRVADDDNLLFKKLAATICPASVFTGKCRLYIQAMYGRPLYDYTKLDEAGSPALNKQPIAVNPRDSGASPHLIVKAYKRRTTSPDFPDVIVSTNTGVYLDTDTGKHWMINFGGDGKTIVLCPLVGEHESMRGLLKKRNPAAQPKTDALSVIDFDHLEAYILSTCLPDMGKAVVLSVAGLPHAYSLGYGWHWDWTGGNADIVTVGARVKNEGVSWTDVIVGEYYVQTSEHHRLNVRPTTATDPETGVTSTIWAATLTVVQPLTEWNVYRNFWCILEPLWFEGGFTKVTLPYEAIRAVIFDADIPIYVFYKRDEIKVARLNIKVTYPGPDEVQMEPAGFGYYYGHDRYNTAYSTLGTNGGFVESKGGGSNHVDGGRIIKVTFTCGGVVLADIPYNLNKLGYRTEVSSKTQTGAHDVGYLLYIPATGEPPAPMSYTTGWPSSSDSPAAASGYTYASGVAGEALQTGDLTEMAYTITFSSVFEATQGTLIVVAPRADAEALFVRDIVVKTTTRSNVTVQNWLGYGYASWTLPIMRVREDFIDAGGNPNWRWIFPYTPNSGYSYKYQWGVSGNTEMTPGPVSVVDAADTEIVEVLQTRQLLISSGVTPVSFADIYEAHDDSIDDISAYTFVALSGTRLDTPTVFAPGRLIPVGSPIVDSPALVGWI